MKQWSPKELIILALVFLLIIIIGAMLATRMIVDDEMPMLTDNVDLVFAFAATITTGIFMWLNKDKNNGQHN